MSKKKGKVKQMIFAFANDGSKRRVMDDNILDEPFMGVVNLTMKMLADAWFENVIACNINKSKVKKFEIIIKI